MKPPIGKYALVAVGWVLLIMTGAPQTIVLVAKALLVNLTKLFTIAESAITDAQFWVSSLTHAVQTWRKFRAMNEADVAEQIILSIPPKDRIYVTAIEEKIDEFRNNAKDKGSPFAHWSPENWRTIEGCAWAYQLGLCGVLIDENGNIRRGKLK